MPQPLGALALTVTCQISDVPWECGIGLAVRSCPLSLPPTTVGFVTRNRIPTGREPARSRSRVPLGRSLHFLDFLWLEQKMQYNRLPQETSCHLLSASIGAPESIVLGSLNRRSSRHSSFLRAARREWVTRAARAILIGMKTHAVACPTPPQTGMVLPPRPRLMTWS